MIRWEQQHDGSWQGSSGDLGVAAVTRDDEDGERWLWQITTQKRPRGWRKGAGHRASWLDARGAADDYWKRWLIATALRPDLDRLPAIALKVLYCAGARFHVVRSVMPFGVRGLANLSSSAVSRVIVLF